MVRATSRATVLLGCLTLAHGPASGPTVIQSPDVDRAVAVFVLDISGDGRQLTSADEGVTFDIDGTGRPVRTAWTRRGGDDGFLFLDTNGNGRVDSGRELIGNGWRKPNGARVSGGDETLIVIQGLDQIPVGIVPRTQVHSLYVDSGDEVFGRLRLWRDANHNGQSERDELQTLTEAKIVSIYLGFRNLLRSQDSTGNTLFIECPFYLRIEGGVVQRQMTEVGFARRN